MGTWEGAVEDEEIAELSFMENNIFTYTSNEMEKTIAGTWTINPEGNAVMVVDGEDEKAIATLVNDEKMILQGESTSNAAVFEKIDKKN